MFWCDNQCSDKALRFRQFASVVIQEGNNGKKRKKERIVLERNSGPRPEARKEETGGIGDIRVCCTRRGELRQGELEQESERW